MKFFFCAIAIWILATGVAAQDNAGVASGISISTETQTSEDDPRDIIIVLGRRLDPVLPLPYEQYAPRDLSTFTYSNEGGEIRYIYIRPIWVLNESTQVEFYSTWSGDTIGEQYGAPTRRGRTGRLVCRKETIFEFLEIEEWFACFEGG